MHPQIALRLSHTGVRPGVQTVYVAVDAIASGHADVVGEPVDIVLVVDTSRSMHGDGIAAVRRALRHWLATLREEDTFALVGFGSWATTIRAPAPVAQLRDEATAMAEELQPDGATAMLEGLRMAGDLLRVQSGRTRRVILITDGRPTDAKDVAQYRREAQRMAGLGAVVDCLGIGEEYNEHILSALVDGTGGLWSHAGDPRMLDAEVAVQVARATQVVGAAEEMEWVLPGGVRLTGLFEYRPAIRALPMQAGHRQIIAWPPMTRGEKRTVVAALEVTGVKEGEMRILDVKFAGTTRVEKLPAQLEPVVDHSLRGLFEVSRTQVLAANDDASAPDRLKALESDPELTRLAEVRDRIERTRTIVADDATPGEIHRSKTVVVP